MKKSWLIACFLGLVAAILSFLSMAECAYPHLIAPVCGALAVMTVFHLVRIFVFASSAHFTDTRPREDAAASADLAATAASVVFLLSPAVRSAMTHFELRLLDFTWAILIVALAIPFVRRAHVSPAGAFPRNSRSWLFAILAGAAWAFGLFDSALFLAFLPFYLILIVRISASRSGTTAVSPVANLLLFFISAALVFVSVVALFHPDTGFFFRRTMFELSSYYKTPGWFYVFFFTTLPFLTVLFSEDGALGERPGSVQLLFHGAITFVTILAVTPPLSPSALLSPFGRLPVVTSAFAAAVAGYLVAYWWVNRRLKTARLVGGIFCLVLAGAAVWNLLSFDGTNGVYAGTTVAERRARAILDKDPDSTVANYVLGSMMLNRGRIAAAEACLRKAADVAEPVPFALNDLAETLRCGRNLAEAERYARKCVERAPKFYVGWETLGSVLMDAGKSLDEAEAAIRKACELAKGKDGKVADVRMLVSLARIQTRRDDAIGAQATLREIESRQDELTDADRAEFKRLRMKQTGFLP